MIGFGLDDGHPLALPLLPDANSAFSVVDAAGRGHDQDARSGLASPRPRIAGANLGKSLVDLGRQLIGEALVRTLMVVVPTGLVGRITLCARMG